MLLDELSIQKCWSNSALPLTKNRNLQINKMRFLSLTGEATMTSRPKSQIIDLLKKIARIAKIARIVKIAIYAVPTAAAAPE